jgi:hypothetical protein
MGVVDLQRVRQTGCKILGGTAIAACEKPPGQDAQPPCHLIEPGAMFGRKMAHMLMGRIAPEGPPLPPSTQVLGHTGDVAPLRDPATDVQAPVGIEMVHHPCIALPLWQWGDDGGQMDGNIGAGARLAQIPDHWPRGDDTRGDQGPYPVPDILVLAFFWGARCHGLCGVFARKNLPASLLIGTDHHTVLRKEAQGIEGEGTNMGCCGLAVRGMAVEPIDTARRFEVGRLQKAPDACTTQSPGVPLPESGNQIVKTPAGGGAVVCARLTGGHRHDLQTL